LKKPQTKRLGELYAVSSRNGIMRPSSARGEGFKMINMGELFAYPRMKSPDMERVHLSQSEIDRFSVAVGDLLFARQSLVLEGAGKSAIVVEAEIPTCFESHLIRVRLDKTRANPFYYFYYFRSATGNGSIQSIVNQVSAAGIRGSDLERLHVLHPPLSTQSRIAAVLCTYDDLIENNNRRIAILEKMAGEIYREWFVRMRFPGHEKAKFHKGVPDGWKPRQLGEIVKTQYGYTARADDEEIGPKFLRITDIAQDRIHWDSVPCCRIDEKEAEKYLVSEGDILVARTGATVGYAKRINKSGPRAVFASFLVRLKPIRPIDSLFLGITVESGMFRQFINLFTTGAAQPQANAHIMSLFPLFHPPDDVLFEFNRLVEPVLDLKERVDIESGRLANSRDLLLSRLMSGKLSVENLDITFPPSMRSPELVEGKEADG
jgi:type I restriction enzyme, S subunit